MSFIETTKFYAGEGNQLFVYIYGMLFSEKFSILYIHPGIPSLKIESTLHLKKSNTLKFKNIVNFKQELDAISINKNYNYTLKYSVNPTIENYKIFLPYIKKIKKLFDTPNTINTINKDDLVYHLRAGDNLLNKNYNYYNGEKLKKFIETINYKNLYVVTNLKKHDLWTMEDLNNYKKKLLKTGDCGSRYNNSSIITKKEMKESLNNLNSVIKVLKDKKCIWKSDTIFNDFNFIRTFNKIIIGVSTFSWWASILSDAEEVYASKNWKYLKGDKNKNLPFVELNNWKTVDF